MSALPGNTSLADLAPVDRKRLLSEGRLSLAIGPFHIRLRSTSRSLLDALTKMYPFNPVVIDAPFADIHAELGPPKNLRRWVRPQVEFRRDGMSPFSPFPHDHAFPLFEWGLNWCVASRAHQYLMLHSGVVENNGKAILMPAWPGAGKSTLTAALVARGWRLLSDEFGLVRPGNVNITPFPRCIPLKNESIDVIGEFAPGASLGPIYTKTRKGTVAHFAPPKDSVVRMHETAKPIAIVFPRFQTGAALKVRHIDKAKAFLKLSGNSFNYEILGPDGFRTIRDIIDRSTCRLLEYGDLGEAVDALEQLVA